MACSGEEEMNLNFSEMQKDELSARQWEFSVGCGLVVSYVSLCVVLDSEVGLNTEARIQGRKKERKKEAFRELWHHAGLLQDDSE